MIYSASQFASISAAHTAMADGDVLELDPAVVYRLPVDLSKSITIKGNGATISGLVPLVAQLLRAHESRRAVAGEILA